MDCFHQPTDAKAIDYATHHLAVAPSAGGEEKVLTLKLDRNVRRPRFSADGRSLFMLVKTTHAECLQHFRRRR